MLHCVLIGVGKLFGETTQAHDVAGLKMGHEGFVDWLVSLCVQHELEEWRRGGRRWGRHGGRCLSSHGSCWLSTHDGGRLRSLERLWLRRHDSDSRCWSCKSKSSPH